MKSDMPAYKDVVDASVQKVRAVLQQRGMLGGFTSSAKDAATAAAAGEIINAISLHLEQYLADNASEAIDQVSGRIQAKLDDLGESGVSISDAAIEKIKSALKPVSEAGGGIDGDGILQKIVEVLNGIGPKVKDFKDFIEEGQGGGAEGGNAGGVPGGTGLQEYAEKKTDMVFDQKFLASFIDEVMPDMSFFDDSLQRLQARLGERQFTPGFGESSASGESASGEAIISIMSAVTEIERAVAAVAATSSSASPLGQIQAKVEEVTASVSSIEDVIWFAVGLAYAFAALVVMSAASVMVIAPQIAAVVALLFAAAAVAAVAAAIVAAVLSAALSIVVILFSASGIIAAPIMAMASAVSTAVTTMVTTVFSMSLSVAGALVSAAGTIIFAAVQAVGVMLAAAASVSASIFASAIGMLVQAAGVVVGVVVGALGAAVGVSVSILSAAASFVASVLVASIAIGAGAVALAAVILAGAVVVALAALAAVVVAGALLLAASVVAGAIALTLAGVAVAIILATTVLGAATILAAGAAFSLVLGVALALMAAAVAAATLAISLAIAAFTVGLTVLLLFVVAIPLAIVWGIQWAFDKVKNNTGVIGSVIENIDGWMAFFRKNEDETPKIGFLEWLGQSIVGLIDGIASWVADWGVWKWLGKAWDWIANWAERLGYAVGSYVTECKNRFINWWNGFVDKLVECGKFNFFDMDVDLFSGARSMKINLASGPNPPQQKVMEDDKVSMVDDSMAVIEDMKREQDDGLNEKVQQYKQRVDAKMQEDNKKQVEDVKASAAEVDAELDALLDEASKKPDIKTPPVPVRTPGARKSLEEQES